jgi:myb proto-oncogene protein
VTKSPSSKQKAVRPQQQPSASDDMLDFAADTAAYIVAEAENKSYLAVEAVKETERISRLAEENDAMLLLAEQLYKQCNVDKYSFLLFTEFSSSMILND